MLITIREIIDIAYITNIDDKLIKAEVIDAAEKTYIQPALTEALYSDCIANPGSYSTLIETYIKPCLAFYVKYLLYSQQIFESAQYSVPDPLKATELVDPASAALIQTSVHKQIIKDILFIARQKEKILTDYLAANTFELYIQPTTKRISGFLILSP